MDTLRQMLMLQRSAVLAFEELTGESINAPARANDISLDSNLLIRVAKLEARPLTVAEAAEVLGVAEKTVRRRIDAGTLASTRTGRRVVVHLDRDPVVELARAARRR